MTCMRDAIAAVTSAGLVGRQGLVIRETILACHFCGLPAGAIVWLMAVL